MIDPGFRLRDKDGRLHFSQLKHMAKSPMHARYAVLHPKEPTPAMRFGSAVDRVVFGRGPLIACDVERGTRVWSCIELLAASLPFAIFDGKARTGKAWEAFREASLPDLPIVLAPEYEQAMAYFKDLRAEALSPDAIVTTFEYERIMGAATAVIHSTEAAPFLRGETQVVAQWDYAGLPCASGIAPDRGGFDVLGSDFISDLKVTDSTHPDDWSRHAWRMQYIAQLAFYQTSNPSFAKYGLHIIGVESKAPHAVTVLSLSEKSIEEGHKLVCSWTELVRQCESSGNWPGYVQTPYTLEPRTWDFSAAAAEEEEETE